MTTLKLAALIASTSTRANLSTAFICFSSYLSLYVQLPMLSISLYVTFLLFDIFSISFPSALLKNSPFSLRSLSAFHCFGLWLAVRIIPPSAPSIVTANSVVGVVANPIFITSQPHPIRVPVTISLTISPEILASLPTTILHLSLLRYFFNH